MFDYSVDNIFENIFQESEQNCSKFLQRIPLLLFFAMNSKSFTDSGIFRKKQNIALEQILLFTLVE